MIFNQIGKMNGSYYNKLPLRSNAILNTDNDDKYCFLWSILAYLHPCNKNHPTKECQIINNSSMQ